MTRSSLTRTALVALIALGMSTIGATAAFADDAAPDSVATAPESSGGASASPTQPAPVEAPAADAPDVAASSEAETATAEAPAAEAAPPAAAEDPQASEPVIAEAAAEVAPVLPPTGADPADPTPYKLLAWQMPCGMADRFCAPGQKLVGVANLAEPSLDALDDLAGQFCGGLQFDLEWDSQATADLIAYGILTAPGQPLMEDHAYVFGEGVGPFKDIDGPACEVGGSVITSASPTPQTCTNGTTLVGGSIQVAVIPGVTYTITGPQSAPVALDATTGLASNLAPGAYSVAFVLDPTLTTPTPGPIAVQVAPFVGACSSTPVTPTDPTDPTTPTELDPVSTSTTTPAVLSDRQLTTLAVTGSDPIAGPLALAAALLLGGLLLQLRRVATARRTASTSTH